MGNSTVRIQCCLPVCRSKQYRFRFLPESSAQVTKTRPCETMGLLLPGPGSVAFHRTLFVGPQWTGTFSSCATPFPSGPRNCGQSAARTMRDNSKATAAAVNIRRFIFKARHPNLRIRIGRKIVERMATKDGKGTEE